MDPSRVSNSLPQGFSLFQAALGAQVQFFPAVGTKELDDMINAYIPGPASMQEKRATVTVDFLSHAQVTGQTFKFYPVYSLNSFVESPVSDSVSSFNASPAASWDWSQTPGSASMSSRSSANARQARPSPPTSTVSRHQTADFSHLPGMKIMTKDGRDVTNSASRGSKTKEQRDHAHLMRIIKACDSCRRKKIKCDPSHKKRSAASQAQPSQASRPAKKVAKSSPPRVHQPTVSPPIVGEDFFSPQVPVDWDASFTFADLEIPDFALPFEPLDEFAAAFIPEDYDFFADPQGHLSPQTSFASSSSSASSSQQQSPSSQPLGETSLFGSGLDRVDSSSYAVQSQFSAPGGSVDAYDDFNLYSPASSFSEDEHMVSIEASSERFSTKSQSLSPTQQSQSQSPAGLSQSSQDGLLDASWYNDGNGHGYEDGVDWRQDLGEGVSQNAVTQVTEPSADGIDVFHDAEWLCAPRDQQQCRVPAVESIANSGAANGDLVDAYESKVSSDGVAHKGRRVQTGSHSSTNSSGRSSTTVETVNRSSIISSGSSSTTTETVTHSSIISSGRYSITTKPESGIQRAPASVDSGSTTFHHTVNAEPGSQTSTQPVPVYALTVATAAVAEGRSSVSSASSIPGGQTLQSTSVGDPADGSVGAVAAGHAQAAPYFRGTLQPGSGRYQSVGGSLSDQHDIAGPSKASASVYGDDGIRKPAVSTVAPLSSQLALLVVCVALALTMMRGVSVASSILPVLAIVLCHRGVMIPKENQEEQRRSMWDLRGPTMSRLRERSPVESSVWSGLQKYGLNSQKAPSVGRILAF